MANNPILPPSADMASNQGPLVLIDTHTIPGRGASLPGAGGPSVPSEATPESTASAEHQDEQVQQRSATVSTVIAAAPAWLLSLILHTVILLVLALCFISSAEGPNVVLEAMFNEPEGSQLEDDILQSTEVELNPLEKAAISEVDLPPVEDPMADAPDFDFLKSTVGESTPDLDFPDVGLALNGRERGMKRVMLAAYGGNDETEGAVGLGLLWLRKNQSRTGLWSLSGPYADGSKTENHVAATGMALLAFQGAGHSDTEGHHAPVVRNGWAPLLKMQDEKGSFMRRGIGNQTLYSQAIATIALCELYGMTKDSKYREPAERAVNYALEIQAEKGGWRYRPGQDSDTSVTGWFVMALQSARMAGIDVPNENLYRIRKYLDSVQSDNGSRYGYTSSRRSSPAMTAEGLLCRQYLGWNQDDERLVRGASYIGRHPIDFKHRDVYSWYYATQVMHHMEGDYWEKWNKTMRVALPDAQVKTGREAGSWDPEGDAWGSAGGRLYTTCLPLYMLEVYYRHMPIYQKVYGLPSEF